MPVFQFELDTSKLKSGATDAIRSFDGVSRATQGSTHAIDAMKKSAEGTSAALVNLGKQAVAALGVGVSTHRTLSHTPP